MTAAPVTPAVPTYPATLEVDYPDRLLNRLTSFFRLFTAIPILIIIWLIAGASYNTNHTVTGNWQYSFETAGIVVVPLVLMILFRKKYPRWWFDWNLALARFGSRVSAYLALLRDEYPSTDEEQAVHVNMRYPNVQAELGRGMPLIKWLLAIPHVIVLIFLGIGAYVCIIIAWFAILFTGRYPRGLFNYVVGVMRWSFRVQAYALLMVTDKYPPFSLDD